MKKIIFLLYFISVSATASSIDIKSIFSKIPVEGSIVISNIDGTKKYVYNEDRAEERFTVASTFKIINTLIALEENVVSGKLSSFVWNGRQHEVRSWNRDQTLESAFKVSCVWCFQTIAKAIGAEKYTRYLKRVNYGDLPKLFKVDEFWLDGSLKLNSYEQTEFLKKVYKEDPAFSSSAYKTLKEIMLVERSSAYSIYAKTGWSPYGNSPVGWYVGYVETGEEIWFFTTNLKISNMSNLNLRKEVTYKVLKSIGAIPNA